MSPGALSALAPSVVRVLLRSRSRPRPVAGRYLLLEELGRGATGVVHRARDLHEGRYVAAKVLRGGDVDAVAGFVRESAHRIAHPHVLAPLGWVAEDDTVLIIMELARGGSLRDLLSARGPLPPATTTALLAQLLDALVAVHARGLVHGDVKPANLLLERAPPSPPRLLLADFGVATSSHRPAASVGGTPAFLPPERLAGAPAHPSQDVYAAGLVARRTLAGPSPLLTLCDSMTRVEPDRRPTAEAALRRLRELSGPG
jgi:eukaryotic-like serine/threonine-protein kinase